MEQSPRLSLSYVMPAQAQKHVTVNETFRRLDALTQLAVRSRMVSAEPAAPAEGDAYILPSTSTGDAWSAFSAGNIAVFQDGAWIEVAAFEGCRAWVSDEGALTVCDGATWNEVSSGGGGGGETALQFGVNTTADATNKLSVKSSAVLVDAVDVAEGGTGDCRINVNKETSGDTASHLFQTGFSGRAEFGLTGDDHFHIKVSANGSSWTDALFIDKDNGNIGVGNDAPTTNFSVYRNDAGTTGVHMSTASWGKSSSNGLFFGVNSADAFMNWREPGSLRFMTNNIERLRIDSTGDVGVGETSPNARLHVDGGGVLCGNPAGGDKGIGAINAQALYDDNILLSCYVFDQALDGAIHDEKWDDRVPDRVSPEEINIDPETNKVTIIAPEKLQKRTHDPMRKFKQRIGNAHDPLTLDGYARHWKEKRHLTSMPNEVSFDPEKGMAAGAWIQRLIETVEIQAVLIDQLHERLKKVEASRPLKRA